MKQILIIILLLNCIFLGESRAQEKSDLPSKMYLNIDNYNFFKNAEYFNSTTEGYTDLGYFLAPSVAYIINDEFQLKAGIHLLKYSGDEKYTKVQPLFSFSWNPNKNFRINLGSLEGGLKHNLIVPLYFSDYNYSRNVENGIQFLLNKKKFNVDLWLNWENHIEKSDSDQERFELGFVGELLALKNKFVQVSVPVQLLFTHRGGQGVLKTGKVESLANFATGISFVFQIDFQYLKSIKINNYILAYSDFSPSNQQRFTKGFGYYPEIKISNKHFDFDFSYWYGYHFISLRGNPMFQPISDKNYNSIQPTRKLFNSKISYKQRIFNGVNLKAATQFFYNPSKNEMDYAYSLFINVELENIRLFKQKSIK